jgi:hypothetical protein
VSTAGDSGRESAGHPVRDRKERMMSDESLARRLTSGVSGGEETQGEVSKEERALLVVTNLATGGVLNFQKLYEWFDTNAIKVAKGLLEPKYRLVETLTDADVTSANFIDRLKSLAADPQTKAVDVILVLHALPDILVFDDGRIPIEDLRDQIKAEGLKHRLRLLYSTACFGASHAPHFVEAGFRVASGAIGSNTNGPYDYPTQLYNWGKGETYRLAVSRGSNWIFMAIHDEIAEALGFDDVDSTKEIAGRVLTRITSPAD